ncbi:unnamed protein product [Adineta ricciae]|uniref:G-protein coupled receptors family 1 profile domain-containing protein n=1 Tax=Adineta ricciae TaxID=249248 RepID=A0A813SE52_ADIRI|nr:unnamed protein product [Adineta ricciae]CAF1431345.1 unnamed protein product [Adineta ricciae]
MSAASVLPLIQTAITRYVLPIIVVFGNVGNLCMIAVYMQKKFRTNSFAIYLIASSFCCLLSVNWSIIPLVAALSDYDLVNKSLAFCRIRGYLLQVSAQCIRYFLVLRCVDRYVLSSAHVSIRAFSRPRIAYLAIAITAIIWGVLSAQLLIWESIEAGRCGIYGLFGQVFAIYVIVFAAVTPLCFMIILGILLMKNLRQSRTQVQPTPNNANGYRLNNRDASLRRLVLTEVLVHIICTFMSPIMQIYSQTTASMTSSKSTQQKQVEAFLNFLAQSLLLYLNYSTTFYVYAATSKSFRNEVKKIVLINVQKLKVNTRNQTRKLIPGSRLTGHVQKTTIV